LHKNKLMQNYNFLQTDFSQPLPFLMLSLAMFVVVMGRYFLIAFFFQIYFYGWKSAIWKARKLNKKSYPPKQFLREITWSGITSFIFSVVGAITFVAFQRGFTAIYLDIHAFPLWYLPISLVISMLIHETYYYWLHRLMHHPKLYRYVHQVHHDSLITSPWTAFSFHPIEGFLEALVLPAIILFLPMHTSVIVFQLTIMTLSATINHLDIEIYPKNWLGNFIGKTFIGATHHSLHHKQFRFNFGLYFTFWDKLSKTESPLFKKEFENRAEI
jgi:Delta7-sterol 5-desaturase